MAIYTIKKGSHRSGYRFAPIWQPKKLRGHITFGKSCLYKPFTNKNEKDINKVLGLSVRVNPFAKTKRSLIVDWPHHIDSFLIGMRRTTETPSSKIELLKYAHVNGKFYHELLTKVEPNEEIRYVIERQQGMWYLLLSTSTEVRERRFIAKAGSGSKIGYKLFPYFGGDEVAPQRMSMDISMET